MYHDDRGGDRDYGDSSFHGNTKGHRGGRPYRDWDRDGGHSSHGGDRSYDRGYRGRGRGGSRGDLRENLSGRRGGYNRDYDDRGSSSGFQRRGRSFNRPRRRGQTSNYRSIGGDMLRSRSRSRSKSPTAGGQWYKVTIHEGNKHDKEWLFQQLCSNTGIEFEPVSYHVLGDKVLFYIQDTDLAQALKLLTIHTNVGKLSIKVWESEPPRERGSHGGGGGRMEFQNPSSAMGMGSMEEDPTEIVQDVLYACYDTNNKTLNMEKIGQNERAKQHNLRVFFNDSVLVNIMMNLIGSKCPDLAGLNISGNFIQNLNHLMELPSKAPELKELDLSNNRFTNLQELEKLKGLCQLKALSFHDNPCCKRYRDVNEYRRDVRAIFPQLVILDNEQLSEPIILGTETICGSIPSCKASFLGPDNTSKIVLAFIENYYKVFDSGKRDDLIMGYDSNSYFSVSVNTESTVRRGPPFTEFTKYSRNLVRCKDSNKRRCLLLCGRIDIVHHLRQFPQTQHSPESFIVDVMCASPNSIVFNVWGVFFETSPGVMRGFSRTFHIAINGDSILIKNDQLTLHQATDSTSNTPIRLQPRENDTPNIIITQGAPTQSATATTIQTLPYSVPTQSNFDLIQTLPQTSMLPLITQPTIDPKEQMIQKLCQDTRLKPDWANKCLEQNEWSYDNALEAFKILQQQNNIPPEALI
ncbi:Nuclear RNA export factor 1-like [Oopsacas minuta]|uniref:Nuclear RNA export factor 1-like n=1 Tax=Oopsacas minuta TaxID=111878 RepID=A0AAV7KDN9_9METZ|nr:Nuclear RNA export factor 1-like [Oopsacas minuta]